MLFVAETGEMWICLSVWLTFELLKAFHFNTSDSIS